MIEFYFNTAPNPMKVALMLAECDLPYQAIPVDTRRGEQFAPAFLAINPNGKLPAIRDDDIAVFDSNAILLYLAEKTGRFAPPAADTAGRAELLSWMMFVASGIGPFSGQSVHFRHAAPEPKDYALNRYDFEAHRHWTLVEQRLVGRSFMLGDTYSVVDMAVWGWARLMPFVLGIEDPWSRYPNVKRLLDTVNVRPAVAAVETLRKSHSFKTEMDADARRFMFPQNERLAARG